MKINNTEKYSQLRNFPNIGPTLEKQLLEIGIATLEDLQRVGSKQAWLKIQEIDESACINRLLAIEGAILGIKKAMLPTDIKEELKEFYHWHKK